MCSDSGLSAVGPSDPGAGKTAIAEPAQGLLAGTQSRTPWAAGLCLYLLDYGDLALDEGGRPPSRAL